MDSGLDYVSSGGGMVTGEWLIRNIYTGGRHTGLKPLVPVNHVGFNTAPSTTYSQVTQVRLINNGVPASFSFPLNDIDGSESFLDPKLGATVFYSSSNSQHSGLVGWNHGQGRVISYSTLLSEVELADSDYQRLFLNTVKWAGQEPVGPPTSALEQVVFHSDREGTFGIYLMSADGSNPTRINTGSSPTWSPDGTKIPFNCGSVCVMDADGSNRVRLTDDGSADWSPEGNKIAFVTRRDGMARIYTMDADGSNQTRLTQTWERTSGGPRDHVWPAWSPDGTKIAYVRIFGNDPQLRVVDVTLPGETGTTGGFRIPANRNAEPAWSPDGTKIAFVAGGGGSSSSSSSREIIVANADGSNVTNLTTHAADDHSPTWSPDGSRIIFVSDRTGNPELQVMDADGSNVACLTNNLATDGSPDWCCPPPLLGQITYVTDRDGTGDDEIYVMSADGSNSTRLTNQSDVDFQPACSQDGNNILFSSHRDGNLELYLMSADGTNPTRLTNNAVPDTEPAWSPRGRIAFVFNSDEIYGMDPDGSNRVRLTNNTVLDYSPDWSPMISGDGMGLVFTSTDRIVFTSVRDGNAEVYVMSGDGNHQTRLTTTGTADEGQPTWSPDGTKIAFTSDRDGNQEIYVMNGDGTNQRRLTNNGAADSHPTWSRGGGRIAFVSERDGNREIYAMDYVDSDGDGNGDNLVNLTNNPAADFDPDWHP